MVIVIAIAIAIDIAEQIALAVSAATVPEDSIITLQATNLPRCSLARLLALAA